MDKFYDKECWLSDQGDPLDCPEKIKLILHNVKEIESLQQNLYESVSLMGGNKAQIKTVLQRLLETLYDPYES